MFLAATLVTAFTAAESGAQVATFEGLANVSLIPTGYTLPGLNWGNMFAFDAPTYGGGANDAGCVVSGTFCVSNGSGNQSALTSATPFDFSSGYFMGWYATGNYGNPVTLSVQGFFGATLVGSHTLVLNTSSAQYYQFDYAGVDQVVFITNGNSGGAWYSGDNLEFNNNSVVATPEPASMLLLGTGLLCVGAVARRRSRKISV